MVPCPTAFLPSFLSLCSFSTGVCVHWADATALSLSVNRRRVNILVYYQVYALYDRQVLFRRSAGQCIPLAGTLDHCK